MSLLYVPGAFLLLAAWTASANASTAPVAESANATTDIRQTGGSTILKLAPADAWLVAYSGDMPRAVKHPLVAQFAEWMPGMAALLKTTSAIFDGPAMLSISGVPTEPPSWRMTFAAHTSLGEAELFARLETDLAVKWNRAGLGGLAGQLSFSSSGQLNQLMLLGPVPQSLTLAKRDAVVFGSSQPDIVEAWLDDGRTGAAFVEGEEFQRLTPGVTGGLESLLYLDTRSLTAALATSPTLLPREMFDIFQLDNIECIALIAGKQRGGSKAVSAQLRPIGASIPPDLPAASPELRLAIGVREVSVGPWHLLASAPSEPSLAKVFPPDTMLLIHGSMQRASDLVDDVFDIAAAVDQVIADEYQEERADFQREIGFDPHTDLLGNFVESWAFGGRMGKKGIEDALLAIRLGSVPVFKRQLQTLQSFYQLEVTPNKHRGIIVNYAHRNNGPFAYAVIDDVLLIAPMPQTVVDAIDAVLDDRSLASGELFRMIRSRVAAETSKLVYLDLGRMLAAEWTPEEYAQAPAEVRALVTSGSAAALSVVPHEKMIAIDLVTKADAGVSVTDTLFTIVIESLVRARMLSARTRSMANVRGLLTSCMIYANDHKKQWPSSLRPLIDEGYVHRDTIANPYKPGKDGAQTPYYLYRHIADISVISDSAAEVVISEPELHDGGAVFGFLDGHVAWITSPRADELLATMRSER